MFVLFRIFSGNYNAGNAIRLFCLLHSYPIQDKAHQCKK